NGETTIYSISDPDCPVDGTFFNGKCSVGGVWIDHDSWPEGYRNKFYGADYSGWFKQLDLDDSGTLLTVNDFFEGGENIVDMTMNPADGCLYYVEYAYLAKVKKICFGGNPPPTAVIGSDLEYGASPLEVSFSGLASTDPDNEELTYTWNFGDGESSSSAEPIHTFESNTGNPEPFLVSLTVTDTAGNSHTAYQTISVNNTPPQIEISSVEDGSEYSMNGVTAVPLIATATDAEQDPSELEYAWQVFLHHNTHNHPEAIDESQETETYLFPEGCGDEEFWYRISLTVRDNGGLEAYDEVEMFPHCGDTGFEFDQMEATPGEKTVDIAWSTLAEVPGSLFIVEKSTDRAKFELAGTLNASGSGSAYEITDQTPLNGITWYRIQVVTPEGFKDYSPLIEVEFPGIAGVRMQPVPFQDRLSIVFE
ncbi:MAG: PKD domain-containing protein, partial [Bacteroidota bacterium]